MKNDPNLEQCPDIYDSMGACYGNSCRAQVHSDYTNTPKKQITINQYSVDFALGFKVVDVWVGQNGGQHLWLEDVSPSMYQLLAVMSMWGGVTRQERVAGKLREAWEIHADHVEWFRELIMKTSQYRDADTAQF